MMKMKSYRQETLCVKMQFFSPKCTKTHLRASLVQKKFLGSLTLAIREGRRGEGRGGEERGGDEWREFASPGAERAEKLVSGSGAVSGTFEKREERERSAEREIGERERSAERAISSHKFP
jgi:hypothetical protein